MTRKAIIAGNWKMHNNISQSIELTQGIIDGIKSFDKKSLPEIVIAPVYTSLYAVGEVLTTNNEGKIKLSAQNTYYEPQGAFTGEISIPMLKDVKCNYVILGHSERRQYFCENDELINKKVIAVLNSNLIPIICCGETLEQREMGVTDSFVASQITKALENVEREDLKKIVIAYEPIWAIGTGKTCDSIEANRVIKVIRNTIQQIAGKEIADIIRILYGGSVKPETIQEQMAQSDIDGALVGGASLKADSFVKIIKGAIR